MKPVKGEIELVKDIFNLEERGLRRVSFGVTLK